MERFPTRAATDPNVIGVRDFIEAMSRSPRLSATAVQTVARKVMMDSPWPL